MRIEAYSASQDRERFLADFCALPERVRQGEFRKGVLGADVLERFLTLPAPFEREFWLCYKGEQAIACLGANVSAVDPLLGYIGFLELDLDAVFGDAGAASLSAACEWLARRGCGRVIAPVDFDNWFPYRFRIDDGDSRIFEWEPVNPPEYVQALEDNGFEIVDRYHSTCIGNLAGFLARTESSYQSAIAAGFEFRPFDEPPLPEDLTSLYRISIESFADNFLFEPISQEQFLALYVGIVDKRKEGLSYFVVDPDGREVGFLFAFLEEWGGPTSAIIMKSIAVLPEARGQGLSSALTYVTAKAGVEHGAGCVVTALIRAGIQSESVARKGEFLWRHDYALWTKTL